MRQDMFHSDLRQDRPSGVPPPGGLGESKRELIALLAAAAMILAIVAAFWLEARP